jgi:hypothetical protein
MLDAIGMPATQREYLLRLWVLEESANVRTLTEAQVIKALKDQLISVEDAAGRLVAMGYSETDVSILLGMM